MLWQTHSLIPSDALWSSLIRPNGEPQPYPGWGHFPRDPPPRGTIIRVTRIQHPHTLGPLENHRCCITVVTIDKTKRKEKKLCIIPHTLRWAHIFRHSLALTPTRAIALALALALGLPSDLPCTALPWLDLYITCACLSARFCSTARS